MAESNDTTIQEELEATSIEWPQGGALGDCLVELYDKCLWTDVNFRCEDHEEGESIKAHKIVLAARSPVFKAMFFGPCSNGKGDIELNTTQSETLQLFLRYLYCDKIALTEEKALAVLEMGHCYQVSNLVQTCVDYLMTVLSAGNVCGILTYAMQYNLTNLKSSCCFFIDNHAKEVLDSEGFMNLSAECLLYILKGDTLNADEKLILEASEKWSRRKLKESGQEETGENIRKVLGEAFYYLRLPAMTSKSFRECVSTKGYLSVEEYADIAAFIGKVPDISVSTNSCVGRCPEKQTLTLFEGYGSRVTKNDINMIFEILVSKDVKLSSIRFCEIIPAVKGPLYKEARISNRKSKETPLSLYTDQAISVTPSKGSENLHVFGLNKIEDIELPQNLQVVLFGSVSIEDLNFRHTFSMSQQDNGQVIFEPPVLLKKRSRPYHVYLKADFRCYREIQLKTNDGNKNEITSQTGHVQVKCNYGSFAGIREIEFIIFSNRDVSEQTDTY